MIFNLLRIYFSFERFETKNDIWTLTCAPYWINNSIVSSPTTPSEIVHFNLSFYISCFLSYRINKCEAYLFEKLVVVRTSSGMIHRMYLDWLHFPAKLWPHLSVLLESKLKNEKSAIIRHDFLLSLWPLLPDWIILSQTSLISKLFWFVNFNFMKSVDLRIIFNHLLDFRNLEFQSVILKEGMIADCVSFYVQTLSSYFHAYTTWCLLLCYVLSVQFQTPGEPFPFSSKFMMN